MKPHLGDARLANGCDITWCLGDVPPNTRRPIGWRTPWIPLGIMVTQAHRLGSGSHTSGYLGEIQVPAPDTSMSGPGAIPKIDLPEFTGSARAPTEPPTPPPTHTPTATPSAWPPHEFTPVADTYCDESYPSTNFGDDIGILLRKSTASDSDGFFRFDLSNIPASETVVKAELTLNFLTQSYSAKIRSYRITDPWNEDLLTYLNRPTYSGIVFDQFISGSYVAIDFKEEVEWWLQYPGQNQGFALDLTWGYPNSRTFWIRESASPATLKVWLESGAPPESTPTSTPTPTLPPNLTTDLQINQAVFHALDRFTLRFVINNLKDEITHTETWVALDAYGQYWFWPSWTHNPENVYWELPPEEVKDHLILDFTWPETGSSADGIEFWGVIRDIAANRYYIDRESFGWQ